MAKKNAPQAKGRPTPRTPVVEKPKRVRPSRAKPVTKSVAPEALKSNREAAAILEVIGQHDTADAFRAASTPANSPIEASIADNLVVYLLELEYKHYEDDSNAVAQLIRRNAQEASTHSAQVSLVISDFTKYTNPENLGSSSGVIELCDGGKLTEELKYYVNQAIYRFTTSVGSRISVTRCVVQRYTLPGIPFII